MEDRIQEVLDYMLNDEEWDLPADKREAQVKGVVNALLNA